MTEDLRPSRRPGAAKMALLEAQVGTAEQLSRADRAVRGKDARAVAPLGSHAEFRPGRSRDPVGLLLGQAASRVPELMPVRHGRMLVSPFTFYRGAALPMAADLAATPASGLRVQLCGDAHLSNFGAFASPERRLVFDVNDFDETLPGPFEWDVKRLAASLVVAGRDNGFPAKVIRKIVLAAAEGYRTAMRGFGAQPLLDVWYAHLDIEPAMTQFRSQVKAKRFKAAEGMLAKAHTRDSTHALRKLTTVVDGQRKIVSDPPMIVPVEDVFTDDRDALYKQLHSVLSTYRRSLQSDRRHLLEQFTMGQVARKVVGVGSVGTRAWILLMDAGDGVEPLFLQAKEAQPSVLAEYCGSSQYSNQGERVVAGQHLHAGPKRHLPRLDPRHRRGRDRPRLLRAPAAGLEVLRAHRVDDPGGHDHLRQTVRVDPGPGACPLRRPRSRWPPTSAARPPPRSKTAARPVQRSRERSASDPNQRIERRRLSTAG